MPQPCVRAQGVPVELSRLPRGAGGREGAGVAFSPAGGFDEPVGPSGRRELVIVFRLTASVRGRADRCHRPNDCPPCFVSGNRGQLGQRQVRPGAPVPDRHVRPGGVARRYAVRQAGPSFRFYNSPVACTQSLLRCVTCEDSNKIPGSRNSRVCCFFCRIVADRRGSLWPLAQEHSHEVLSNLFLPW